MKRIAVLTSGGDAPGMNGAIRAVVRTGIGYGWEVFGVRNGYAGLISGEMAALSARDVGGILQRGGTILGSARSAEFETVIGREKSPSQSQHARDRGLGGDRRERFADGGPLSLRDGIPGGGRGLHDRQ